MSNPIRNMKRKILRKMDKYEARPQLTHFDESGGYKTLTPTGGWKRVSGARIRAQQAMLMKVGFVR